MSNYQNRLDRIEAGLLPTNPAAESLVVVLVKDGESPADARAAALRGRGLPGNTWTLTVMYVSPADARL